MAEARPDCPGCAELTKRVEALLARVSELEAGPREGKPPHSVSSGRLERLVEAIEKE